MFVRRAYRLTLVAIAACLAPTLVAANEAALTHDESRLLAAAQAEAAVLQANSTLTAAEKAPPKSVAALKTRLQAQEAERVRELLDQLPRQSPADDPDRQPVESGC